MDNRPHQRSLRDGRHDEEGYYYFITTVTHNREEIFLHPLAADAVMDSLLWLDRNDRISLVASVIMSDHLHFVAQLKNGSIAKVMHSLKSYSANIINDILGRNGPLWERHYYDRAIRDEKSLTGTVRYCLENPVRKGLVPDIKAYKYWYCVYEV